MKENNVTIKVPINEKRIFKYGVLPNHIKYVVIQDKDTISNVSMAVKVGSVDDPKEYMGLAHFLEHMLFLGSNKFPKESYFNEKIHGLGGSCNAYTGLFETVYFFNVVNKLDSMSQASNSNLDIMLDIFSRFFIDPLFDKNSVEREINAIDSEHKKNMNDNLWIGRQIIYNLTKKDCKLNRFTTGTKKTLGLENSKSIKKDVDILRNRMIKFYNSYYCSNNMCLTIQSNESISKIEEYIYKYFSLIPSKKAEKNSIIQMNKFTSVNNEYQLIPPNNSDNILYFWDVPTIHYYLDNKAINIVNDIIEYNGSDNLQSILKKEGLANNIMGWYLTEGLFVLKINISRLHDTIDQIKNINIIVANYFNTFLQNLDWDKYYLYESTKYKINYNYSNMIDNNELVNMISVNLHYYKPSNVYCGSSIVTSENSISDIMAIKKLVKMLHFSKANIIYSTHAVLDKMASKKFLIDQYYLKKYGKINNSYILFDKVNNVSKPNIILDSNFLKIKPLIKKISSKLQIPSLYNNIWYGGSSKTYEPVVFGSIFISDKKLVNSVDNYLLTLIACYIVNQHVAEIYSQQFELGYYIGYNLSNIDGVLSLSINGLNYKYTDFFNNVLDKIKLIIVDKTTINITIEKIKNNYINIDKVSPWEYINIQLNIKQYIYYYDSIEILNSINNLLKTSEINYIEVITKRIKLITNICELPFTTIIYGNILDKDIPKLKCSYKESSIPKPLSISNISIPHPNKNEINKLVMFMFNCGSSIPFNPKKNAIILILSMILEQPAYHQLRTQEQLGYLVKSYLYTNSVEFYIVIKIQTNKNIKLVEKKMNIFLKWFEDYLMVLDIDIFNEMKKSAIALLLNKPSSLEDMLDKYIDEIRYKTYIFDRSEQIANYVNRIELKHIHKLYTKILDRKSIIKIT